MDPLVTVDSEAVTVEPGGQASVTVRVRNLSSIVEGFRLDVLGDAAGWAQVLPGRIEVLPQGEAQATVLFAPPAGGTTRAGQVPFAVRVVSQVDPASSAVAEGDLHVGGVAQSQARITPATGKGRWSAKYRLEFSNWGNSPMRLALEASDPDEALGFLLTPDFLDLPLGTARSARLKVRARKPFFRGTPLRRAFRVVGRPIEPGTRLPAPGPGPQPYGYDPTQPAVDGAFEQRAIVGRGVMPLAALLLVGAGVAGYLASRPGDDPADESVAPPPPQELTVEPIGSTSAQLSWQPGDRVDSYTVYDVDPTTKTAFEPVALRTFEDVPGEQGRFEVGELKPATEHCFQVAAIRGEAKSGRTQPECITTPAAPPAGAPSTPTDVTAERQDDGSVLVTWADASGGTASHLVLQGATVLASVEPPLGVATVTLAEGEDCVRVVAKLGDLQSDPSEEACAEAAPAGAPSGAGGTLGVIAVPDYGLALSDDPGHPQIAADALAKLKALDPTASVLAVADYPDLQAQLPRAAYLVYIPGFDDAAQAQARSAALGLTCGVYTPGAPRAGAAVPTLPAPDPAATGGATPTTAAPATTTTTPP